jgi:hypothetical protein
MAFDNGVASFLPPIKPQLKRLFIDKFPVEIGLYTKKKQGTLERA